jgi:hypothetical protein
MMKCVALGFAAATIRMSAGLAAGPGATTATSLGKPGDLTDDGFNGVWHAAKAE